MTTDFWTGFMIGAAFCSALTIAFELWQSKREEHHATNNQRRKNPCK